MLRPLAVVLAVLIATPAVAAPSPVPVAAPAPFKDPQDRFTLSLPPRWTVGPDPTNAAITTATGPNQQAMKLVAAKLAGDGTLETYVAGSLAAWSAIWKVREDQPAQLGPLAARRLVIDQTIGNETTRLLKWFATQDGHVYVLTAYASPAAFAVRRAGYEAIAATFVPGAWTAVQAPTAAGTHEEPRWALALPAGWRLASRMGEDQVIWKKQDGKVEGTLRVRFAGHALKPMGAKAAVAKEKATFADDPDWHLLAEGQATLGGKPAHRLVTLYRVQEGDAVSAEYEALWAADPDGDLLLLSFGVDAEEPTPALRADLEKILAGFRWR